MELDDDASVFGNQAATVADRARIGLKDPTDSAKDPANVFLLNHDASLPRPTTNDNNRNNRIDNVRFEQL